MRKANTYHLDQNVRGIVSSGNNNTIGKHIMERISKRYPHEKHEAILPLALLEYAGISLRKEVFKDIEEVPESMARSKDIKKITNFLQDELKKKLPENKIHKNLKDKLNYSNEYARLFCEGCIDILPDTYDLIIYQLSWDRLSHLEWSKYVPDTSLPSIRKMIAYSLCKEPNLYALRHFRHLQSLLPKEQEQLSKTDKLFLEDIKQMKLKSNEDIGDCELIHTAIHGQTSVNFQNIRTVDCYTMDNSNDIKRRLRTCFFFYKCLKHQFNYTLNMEYSGRLYIIDQHTGKEIDEIIVKDYEKVLKK